MIQLKPCPFCDSKAELFNDEWGDMVRCTNCGINTRGEFAEAKNRDNAISLWNKRVTPSHTDET